MSAEIEGEPGVCRLGLPLSVRRRAPGRTASPAPADAKPKADIIFMHANVYTGVPANTPFSSILREEAIAVRGDRIQAVGQDRGH